MADNKIILVTGGTGKQGSAVARNLVQNGYAVKILTRNPDSPGTLALKNHNVTLVKGDLNKPETYREHLTGVHGYSAFRHIRELSMPYTIIRTASFYVNFLIPQVKKGILKGKLTQTINSGTIMPYIAADDIGKAAVKIFGNFQTYSGRTLILGNEQLDSLEVAEKFSNALNRKMNTIVYLE